MDRHAAGRQFPAADAAKDRPGARQAVAGGSGHAAGVQDQFRLQHRRGRHGRTNRGVAEGVAGKIGIDVEIQKKPDAEFNTLELDKSLGFFTDAGTAWLPATYYYFYLYFTRDQRWNFSSWKNTDIEQLSAAARFELDKAKYTEDCIKMIEVFAGNVPLIMLWQPNLDDAVMAANIDGYTYQFYRQADFRDLKRV